MPVSNYFVNSFYSAGRQTNRKTDRQKGRQEDRRCYMISKITGDSLYKIILPETPFLDLLKSFTSLFVFS
jgi:hypothetical protein